MKSYQARIELGEITETEYMHGGYRMKIAWHRDEDYAQVSVYDLGELHFPMIWSKGMTKAQARGAHELFEQIGYYDYSSAQVLCLLYATVTRKENKDERV